MFKSKLTPIVAAICLIGGLASQADAKAPSANEQKSQHLIDKTKAPTAQTNPSKVNFLELGATPVISSPYIGIRSEYDASDLIVNTPTYNQDLQLLRQQQKLQQEFSNQGLQAPATPVIELSGKIEGQVMGGRGTQGERHSDIDLSGTEFDITGHFTPWFTGFIALSYDNDATDTGVRTDNSRIYLNKAWVTLGNLNQSPFYLTIGQRHHFGQYSSAMTSSPLTQLLTRIKARSLLVGYQQPGNNGIYSTLYTFKGDANVGSSHINQLGASLGYRYTDNTFSTDVGIDLVNNIADADGMQNTGVDAADGFAGFAASSSFERLVKRVPGAALHGKLSVGPYRMVAEYTGATTRFDSANLSFNGLGAKPQAFNIEGAYEFKLMNKPASIAIGYGQTKDALALNLPQRRLITALNLSMWKNTIASLEFRRDANYPGTDVASGQTAKPIQSTGGFSNMLTAQFGVYF